MLGHPRNPTRFGAGQAHMKISILSEELLNRIFISPAWAAASIHLNPFLRILRSFDSGSSCASWQPPCGNSRMVGNPEVGNGTTLLRGFALQDDAALLATLKAVTAKAP